LKYNTVKKYVSQKTQLFLKCVSFVDRIFPDDRQIMSVIDPISFHIFCGRYFPYLPELRGTLTNHTTFYVNITTPTHANETVANNLQKMYLFNRSG